MVAAGLAVPEAWAGKFAGYLPLGAVAAIVGAKSMPSRLAGGFCAMAPVWYFAGPGEDPFGVRIAALLAGLAFSFSPLFSPAATSQVA